MPDDSTTASMTYTTRTTESQIFRSAPAVEPRTAATVRHGATARDVWHLETGRELAWLEGHQQELQQYEEKWIAISQDKVIVDRDEFADVRAFLDSEGISDALIIYVQENIDEPELFID